MSRHIPGRKHTNTKFQDIEKAIESVETEYDALNLVRNYDTSSWEIEDIPDDLRWRLLALACSLNDYIFWVRKKAQEGDLGNEPGDQMYNAIEVESQGDAWGVTPREALENYFRHDVLDLPRGGE